MSFSIDEKTTLIVGRNNTGKTSFAEAFRSFLNPAGRRCVMRISINLV
ncbi:AAA family ATPase (plasmid) [Vibrio alginolyticus]